ncbi:hypothetical protein ERJ75_001375700 [Trypanosoma vivax]|nr:hypothetical protein ERJ75_001375700 [Trypanosoma vivax]
MRRSDSGSCGAPIADHAARRAGLRKPACARKERADERTQSQQAEHHGHPSTPPGYPRLPGHSGKPQCAHQRGRKSAGENAARHASAGTGATRQSPSRGEAPLTARSASGDRDERRRTEPVPTPPLGAERDAPAAG